MRIGYSLSQILLHWLIAVLVVVEFVTSGAIADLLRAAPAHLTMATILGVPPATFHTVAGLLIFMATGASLILARLRGRPLPEPSTPLLIRTLDYLARITLYLTLLALPVSGALMAFARIESAGLHGRLATLLLVAVVLHLVVIAWHAAIRRDSVATLMLWPEEPSRPPPARPPQDLPENRIAETGLAGEPPGL